MRRGLDLKVCLQQTGMIWLPDDMFNWDSLRFKPEVLLQTAFVTGHYRTQFRRYIQVYLEERCAKFTQRILQKQPKPFVDEDYNTL